MYNVCTYLHPNISSKTHSIVMPPISRFTPATHMAWSYVVQFHDISEFHVHSGRCLTCESLSNKAKLAASTALLSPRAATWTELKVPWLRCSFKHQMGCIFLIWYLQYLYFLTTHKSKIKPKYHLSELVMMRLYMQDLCINKYMYIWINICTYCV